MSAIGKLSKQLLTRAAKKAAKERRVEVQKSMGIIKENPLSRMNDDALKEFGRKNLK